MCIDRRRDAGSANEQVRYGKPTARDGRCDRANGLIHWATLEISAMSVGEFASGACPGTEETMQCPIAPERLVDQVITIRLTRSS
ncbi:hypothetical protein D9M68_717270 [compost metagenome]